MTPHARLRRGTGLVALVLAVGAVGCASSQPFTAVGPREADSEYTPQVAPAPPYPAVQYQAGPVAPLLPPLAFPDLGALLAGMMPAAAPGPSPWLPPPWVQPPPPKTQRTTPITPYNPEPSPHAAAVAANDPRVKMARSYARDHQIRLDSWHDRFTSNTDGYSAPIAALADGGAVLIGTRPKPDGHSSTSWMVRLDAHGRVQWERSFDQGYPAEEGNTLLATNGGFLVHISTYPNPANAPFHRFLQLDPDGSLRWGRRLRGDGGANTPHPQFMRENSRGTYDLKGHIYKPGAPETPWAWDGELDRYGRLLRDETGNFDPYMIPSRPTDPGIFN